MEYNEFGYIAGSPLPAASWRKLCPNTPPGLVVLKDAAPPGVLIFQNYIPAEFCQALAAECEKAIGIKSAVLNLASVDTMAPELNNARVCETIAVNKLQTDVTTLVRNAFVHIIAPHFQVEIEAFERPDILRYHEGGEYKPHADADTWVPADKRWRRTVDRDLSLLMYFNQEYEGGELVFSNFGSGISPRSGMLVAFPSDHRYIHVAHPVKSGVRYAIVSWAQVKGSTRVQATQRPDLVRP